MRSRRLLPALLACVLLAGCNDGSQPGSRPAAGVVTTQTPATAPAGAPGREAGGAPRPKRRGRHRTAPAPAAGDAQPSRAECLRKKRQLTRGGGLSPEGRLELQGDGCGYLTK